MFNMDKNIDSNPSRRKFLELSLTTRATTLIGGSVISSVSGWKNEKSTEKVKLLSPDGQLVEVDSSDVCHHLASQNIREVDFFSCLKQFPSRLK